MYQTNSLLIGVLKGFRNNLSSLQNVKFIKISKTTELFHFMYLKSAIHVSYSLIHTELLLKGRQKRRPSVPKSLFLRFETKRSRVISSDLKSGWCVKLDSFVYTQGFSSISSTVFSKTPDPFHHHEQHKCLHSLFYWWTGNFFHCTSVDCGCCCFLMSHFYSLKFYFLHSSVLGFVKCHSSDSWSLT